MAATRESILDDLDLGTVLNDLDLEISGAYNRCDNQQFKLGIEHERKGELAQAFTCFKNAANQGFACSQFKLGGMYENGRGVKRDVQEAIKWYKRAAEAGHITAKRRLAFIYEQGSGVERNVQEAIKWFKRAAEAGDGKGKSSACHILYTYSLGANGEPKWDDCLTVSNSIVEPSCPHYNESVCTELARKGYSAFAAYLPKA